ncbi:MAG: hypothetical protein OEX81_03435 [Candidatus Pacebacteria bacterium]|nr:hypothetical protein [Candidatus Paceibacterota bacterium]
MNKHMVLFFTLVMSLLVSLSVQAHGESNCITVSSRNYYAREIHNDYLVHDIELCLSRVSKSITYELPPLTVPLTLETTDNFYLWVTIKDIETGDEVLSLRGRDVTFELPVQDGSVRYEMKVSLSNRSEGIIIGSVNGQEVGKIILLDTHYRNTDTLTVAMGGLSAEWWFAITDMPDESLVNFALTSIPDVNGHFDITNSWQEVPVSTGSELPEDYLVILDDDWSATGDYAIQVTFTN